MPLKDIFSLTTEEKYQVYEGIHQRYLQGKPIQLREHRSGFPAITIKCEGDFILTDCLSLEAWWEQKKKTKERSEPGQS